MKILLCCACGDAVALRAYERQCECGLSSGRHVDRLWVEIEGPCVVVGTRDDQIRHAMRHPHEPFVGPYYRWWTVPDGHHMRRRVATEMAP